jgi:hypothetical protein
MNLRNYYRLTIVLLLFAPHSYPMSVDSSIVLEGMVPSSISDTFLLAQYNRLWQTIAPEIPIDGNPLHIIYYSKNTAEKFGPRLPEWGGGGAIGRDTIIVPLDRLMFSGMDAGRVTVHELVHSILARAYGSVPVPRWFHEGLAMTLSGELLFDEQVVVSRALFSHRLLPFDTIENVNALDQYGAALAYSESHLAVAYLIDEYGIDTIPALLHAVRTTGSFDSAMNTVLGFSPKEFESFAVEHIVKQYSFVFLISDTALYWIPITFLFIAAFIAVTIRNKKKRRRMEEEEKREEETRVESENVGMVESEEAKIETDTKPG